MTIASGTILTVAFLIGFGTIAFIFYEAVKESKRLKANKIKDGKTN